MKSNNSFRVTGALTVVCALAVSPLSHADMDAGGFKFKNRVTSEIDAGGVAAISLDMDAGGVAAISFDMDAGGVAAITDDIDAGGRSLSAVGSCLSAFSDDMDAGGIRVVSDMDAGGIRGGIRVVSDMDAGGFKKVSRIVSDMDAGGFKKVSRSVSDMDAGGFRKGSRSVSDMDAGGFKKSSRNVSDMDAGGFKRSTRVISEIDAGGVAAISFDMDAGGLAAITDDIDAGGVAAISFDMDAGGLAAIADDIDAGGLSSSSVNCGSLTPPGMYGNVQHVLSGPVSSIDVSKGLVYSLGQAIDVSASDLSHLNVGDYVAVFGTVTAPGMLYADSVNHFLGQYVPGSSTVFVAGIPSNVDRRTGRLSIGELDVDYNATLGVRDHPESGLTFIRGTQPSLGGLLLVQ